MRHPASSSTGPSGGSRPGVSTGPDSGTALRSVVRAGLTYALLYLFLRPLQGMIIGLLSVAAWRALPLVDRPPVITSLDPHGKIIVVWSYLTGPEQPMTAWNGWFIQIYLAVSLTLLLALPLRSLSERVRLLALSLPVVSGVTLAITLLRLRLTVEQYAVTQIGITTLTPTESATLHLTSWLVMMTGLFLFPALLVLRSCVSLRLHPAGGGGMSGASVSPPRRAHGVRLVAVSVSVGIATLVAASVLLNRKENDASPRRYLAGWEKILSLNPTYVPALVNVGVGHDEEGRSDEAIDSYRIALEIDPDHLIAHYNLGNAFFKRELYDQAALSFGEVLRREPDHVGANKNLGIALLYLDRPCEALRHMERSTELDPRMRADPRMREQIRNLRSHCPAS